MKSLSVDAAAIDALLPQHQCGLCGYKACYPYAQALAAGKDHIGRCPPGGVETLHALARVSQQDPSPYVDSIQAQAKPPRVAVIREDACIGCTKCIQVCPTDAIMGASKQMHTVIADACTGCELCVPACPVDCIDLVQTTQQQSAEQWRERYQRRQQRLIRRQQQHQHSHTQAKLLSGQRGDTIAARKAAIEAAVQRVKEKRQK